MTVFTAPTATASETDVSFAPLGDRSAHDPETVSQVADMCGVCPHPMATHDSLGGRFCRATLAGAITRGCICR
jgi:hypothetical protein